MSRSARIFSALIGAFTFFHSDPAHALTNEFRGYWADVFHAGFLNSGQTTAMINTLRAANCNAVVAEIRARANAYYNGSPYEPKGPGISPSDYDPLADMIAQGHDTSDDKQRIEIHAWLVTYKTSGTQPTSWMHKHFDGQVSTSEYDPGHPKVQERVFNVAMDITTRYDIDGLNFDYVRYPENTPTGPTLWGYNDVTVARFNARFGRTGKPDVNDPVWNQFRRDQVTALVRKIYLHVLAVKPWVKVSADTITWNPSPTSVIDWTNSARAYNDVLQDWRSWMEEGILDYSIPMNYYRHGALNYAQDFMNWMNFAKDHQYNRHTVIGPGVYMNFATNVIKQIRLTREPSPNGNFGQGFCGYSYAVAVTNSGVSQAEMFQALVLPSEFDTNPVPVFAERATIPDMPWKSAPTKGHLKGFIVGGIATNYLDGAAISISGNVNRSFISDATGFFGSVDLPPGDYELNASFAGFGSITTNFSVMAGLVTTKDLLLPVTNAPPMILESPQSVSVIQGTNVTFTVISSGTDPLSYQWKFNGGNLSEATSSLSLSNVTTNNVGNYWVIVSNAFGSATSQVAVLAVSPPPRLTGTTVLWQLSTNSRSYFSTAHLERGLGYNPMTGNLLLLSRNLTTNIYVLNGDTGDDLHRLTLSTNVTGGTFPLLMLGVADDGVVYAGNLSLPGSGPFRLYRWANDSTSSVPEVAFSGDPGQGNSQRWGDTFDVRGAGTNTQILLGSRLSTIVSILTTTDGTNFSARVVNVSGVPNASFGLGISFGQTNTFWGKSTNAPLRQIAFDLIAGTGTVIRTIGEPTISNSIIPIGVSAALDLFAGIAIETPDNLKLYDLSPSGVPTLLVTNRFLTDTDNLFFTGSVDFGPDRVYALDSNNGITALKLNFVPGTRPIIHATAMLPNNRLKFWVAPEQRPYIVEVSSTLTNWTTIGTRVPDAGYIEVNDPNWGSTPRFYRIRVP